MGRLFFWLPISFLLLQITTSFAQGGFAREDYNWEPYRKITYQLTGEEAKAPAIILLDRRFIDYSQAAWNIKRIDLYITRHTIVRVNDDKGINEFDKVYLPMIYSDDLINLKVRIISKDGNIKEIKKKDVKFEFVNRNLDSYNAFDVEGLEPGSELEYFYTIKRYFANRLLWGDAYMYGAETFQADTKVKEATFAITYPDDVIIDTKSYNGFPNPVASHLDDPIHILTANIKDIPPIPDEMYSTGKANCMKIAYKVNRFKSAISANTIFTWNHVMTRYYRYLYRDFYPVPIPEELKIDSLTTDEKIIAIENYIKKNIALKLPVDTPILSARQVLKERAGDYWGAARLYAAFFKQFNIPFELVITSNRYKTFFDPGFIDFNNLHQVLFYFPASKKFLCPGEPEYRYGPPIYQCANNYGLFIQSEDEGHVELIPFMDVNHNKYRIKATVVIDSSMDAVEINKVQSWEGYPAIKLKWQYDLLAENQRAVFLGRKAFDGLNDVMPEQKAGSTHLDKSEPGEPFTLTTRFTSSSLIERAGNNYRLNVGLLIGPQNNLYQQEKRENDIELEYPMQYLSTIYVQIPKGYRVKGLENASVDKALMEKGQRACQFVSSYTQDDNGVAINVREYYIATSYTKERYEEFRQVVNAAADFNKLQLVLEKE